MARKRTWNGDEEATLDRDEENRDEEATLYGDEDAIRTGGEECSTPPEMKGNNNVLCTRVVIAFILYGVGIYSTWKTRIEGHGGNVVSEGEESWGFGQILAMVSVSLQALTTIQMIWAWIRSDNKRKAWLDGIHDRTNALLVSHLACIYIPLLIEAGSANLA